MVTRIGVVFLALCFFLPPAGIRIVESATDKVVVKVIPERTTVRVNNTFKVRFVVESGSEVQAPNWAPLNKNFHVRQGGRKLESKSVNGVRRILTEWVLHLKPKRTGKLQIPSIQFGATRSKAKPVTVQAQPRAVKKAKKPKDFFIEVTATPTSPYVQAQVLFTLKVFMVHSLRGSVSPPQSDSKAIVEGLGDAKKYRKKHGNRHYEVYERKYLIYPQASGKMKIKPVALAGSYKRGGRNFAVNKKSSSLVLDVKEVPSSFPGKFWLPAKQVALEEKWSSDLSSWQAGDPVKRRLKLRATGLLARQLPEVSLPEVAGFRLYTEQASFKNSAAAGHIVGAIEQSAVLIPAQAGVYTLPGLKIPWWNTAADRVEFAELPEKKVTINEPTFGALVMDESGAQTSDAAEPTTVMPATMVARGGIWFWFSMIFLFGWLVTVVTIWRGDKLYRRIKFVFKRKKGIREAKKALQKACRQNDTVRTKDELLKWSEVLWPDDLPTSIAEVGRRCGGEVEECIEELNRALYGTSDSGWQGSALWESLDRRGTLAAIDERNKEMVHDLEPLHKL